MLSKTSSSENHRSAGYLSERDPILYLSSLVVVVKLSIPVGRINKKEKESNASEMYVGINNGILDISSFFLLHAQLVMMFQ